MSSKSQGVDTRRPVRPRATDNTSKAIDAAVKGDEGEDELTKRADDLMRRINELEEKLVREEGRRPVVSPTPERPTEQEVQEHNVTHTPP